MGKGRAERSTQQTYPVIRKTADKREGRGGEGREGQEHREKARESEQIVTVKLLSSWEAAQGPH